MINLYQGRAKVDEQDSRVFVLDSEEIITQYKQIVTKYAVKLPEPRIYVKYLEMRFNFTVDVHEHEHIPVRRILSFLRNIFPQFIWTQIIEYGDVAYKLEFIPVSWSYCDSVKANQVLSAAISEMGFGNERALASIKEQMQEVFQEMFSFSPENTQNEVNPTLKKTKVETVKTENTQKRKTNDTSVSISAAEPGSATEALDLNRLKLLRNRLMDLNQNNTESTKQSATDGIDVEVTVTTERSDDRKIDNSKVAASQSKTISDSKSETKNQDGAASLIAKLKKKMNNSMSKP